MKRIKRFNENLDNHDITIDSIGQTYTETQTNASFIIDGIEYTFTIFEKGPDGGEIDVDIICDTELPFELTDKMKDEMYMMYGDYVSNQYPD